MTLAVNPLTAAMRRLNQQTANYRVEFAPSVKPLLAKLPGKLTDRIVGEVHALAELAELAPIPQVGSLTDATYAPPLHLTVGDWIVTYVVDRKAKTVRVIHLEAA